MRLLPLSIGLLISSASADEASAGLLSPFLALGKSSLENRLSQQCLSLVSGENESVKEIMQSPCKSLAKPLAQCLLDETKRSGQTLPIIKDVIMNQFGEASELVLKRCVALTLRLPRKSLDKLPLRRIFESLKKDET